MLNMTLVCIVCPCNLKVLVVLGLFPGTGVPGRFEGHGADFFTSCVLPLLGG